MDTKEILWDSNRPKFGEGTIFGGEDVAPLPLVTIEEDLQRAITALRAVPTFSWSVNSLLEGQSRAAVASAEYVWKAEDFEWPYKDRPSASQSHDRNFDRRHQRVDSEKKDGIGDTPSSSSSDVGRSEIRTDSFTVLSKRIHLAPDKSCRMSDESRASSFRVCLSGQKKNMAEGTDSKASQKISKPPPRHPLSSSSRVNSDVTRRAAPPVPPKPPPPFDPRRPRSEVDGAKAEKRSGGVKTQEMEEEVTSDAVQGIFDFYERSLDILESEELKRRRKSEEVSSPRSNSPEALLEELLDSISADEYDTLPPSDSKKKDVAKRALPSSTAKTKELCEQTSSSSPSSSSVAASDQWKPCEMKTFMLTGFQNLGFESLELAKFSAREQNNNDIACCDNSKIHRTKLSSTKQSNTSPQDVEISPITSHAQLPTTTTTVYQNRHPQQATDEPEPTPEDIFEEIMDSMESSSGKRKGNTAGERWGCLDVTTGRSHQAFPNRRDAKNAHYESVFGFSRDYCADNGLLSVCYNRSRSGMQLCLREKKIRKSRSEDAAKNPARDKLAASPPPPPSMDIHPDSGKPSTATPSPVSSSSVSSSSSFSVYPPPETRPTSRRTQESIYRTVKQNPAPPLRQKATDPSLSSSSSLSCFAARQQQHSLTYNFRQPPAPKQQQQQQEQSPSEARCSSRGGETANGFEAKCDTSVEKCSNSVDQKALVLRLPPKDPDKDFAGEEEEEEEEAAKRSCSSAGIEKDPRRQRLVFPDEKRNRVSSKREEKEEEEEILFSRGFADDKNYGEGEEGDDVDLDLDAEFSRNLDACTCSDVECPSIDKLMSAESQFASSIIAENKCTKQKMKSPRKLGILIAKRRLQKAPHAVDNYEDLPTTSLDLLLGSTRPSYDQKSETGPTWKPSQPTEPRETIPFSDQVGARTQDTDDLHLSDGGNFYSASGDVVSNQELERDVGKRHETRVLSEEVTSQELLLKIVWPKKEDTTDLLMSSKATEKRAKPPFRDLHLHRILRICDDDDPDSNPPRISQTSATRDLPTRPGIENRHDSPNPEEDAMEKPEERTNNCRSIEHVSGSPVAVSQRETVRVIRAPLANGHAVKNIKQVVEGVGYTIIQDFERSPVKRNIKVSCEATECKSESAIRDHQDVTIIRNTILDTLRSNTTPALSRQGSSVPDEN